MTEPNTYRWGDWYYPVSHRPKIAKPRKPIRLAHIDTGFAQHPCVTGRFNPANAMSFYDGIHQGPDQLLQPKDIQFKIDQWFRSHGLATGAFIIGGTGWEPGFAYPLAGMLSDTPPGIVDFIPMRVIDSVDLGASDCKRLSTAIHWALNNDCKVISMSFGSVTVGSFFDRASVTLLRTALEAARDKGVILCCASGQGVPFMMYPGMFSLEDLCITCGPSTRDKDPWVGSAMAPSWEKFDKGYVTICAPGVNMPKAYWRDIGDLKAIYRPGLMESEGSSYSTAFVASIAALWLAKHDETIELMEANSRTAMLVPKIFKQVVQDTATSFSRRQGPEFGPGIINPHKVLDTNPYQFLLSDSSAVGATVPALPMAALTTTSTATAAVLPTTAVLPTAALNGAPTVPARQRRDAVTTPPKTT